MSICLYASEVAIITRHNKWKKLHEFVLQLWQRNYPDDFKNSLKEIEERKKVKFVPEKTETEVIEAISKKRKLDIMKSIDKDAKTISDLHKGRQNIIKQVKKQNEDEKSEIQNFMENIDNLKLDKKKLEEKKKKIIEKFDEKDKKEVAKILSSAESIKKEANKKAVIKKIVAAQKKETAELKKNMENFGNRNFGTKNETNVVKLFEDKRGEPVILDNKFHKKVLFKHNNVKWYIGGRVDGLLEDGTIVEIKNRMHRLFYRLKDYERIQIMSYMYIFDTDNGVLVESISGRMNIIDVEFSDIGFEKVKDKLKTFAKFFYNFLGDIDSKIVLLMGTESEKESLVSCL